MLLTRPSPTDTSTPHTSAQAFSPLPSPSGPEGEVVDASVDERGWVVEPITPDPETYIRAALAAAGTFDTTRSSRDEWLSYLDSWFTPDTRYTSEADRRTELNAAKLELRQSVVLPEESWESLSGESGRVTSRVNEDLTFAPVEGDVSGDMTIGTGLVDVTFTRSDPSGEEASYTETAEVSVQVLCGVGSVPSAGSGQRPGDCKVVRFFAEPIGS
jgi:hypothetical protein